MDEIKELKLEQDRWHRKFNDALIEIAKLNAQLVNCEYAIKKLIDERDVALKDLSDENDCANCKHYAPDADVYGRCDLNPCHTDMNTPYKCKWVWRGVKR